MNPETFLHGYDDVVAQLASQLSTRTLQQLATESRLDQESLKDVVDRYEIDFAWQVLGSDQMLEATISVLDDHLGSQSTAAHRQCVAAVLKAVAESMGPDVLMSFDNDVPDQLGRLLLACFAGRSADASVVNH